MGDEDTIRSKGLEIFRMMEGSSPSLFDRKKWAGQLMSLAMADPDLKVRLFRFVDVLPTLNSPDLVMGHIREYFLDEQAHLPALLKKLLAGIRSGLPAQIAAHLVRRRISSFARTFIAGETLADAQPVLEKLRQQDHPVTIDLLGEAALSEKEAEEYLHLYLVLITSLQWQTEGWQATAPPGTSPAVNVSVKASSLYSRIAPVNYSDSVAAVKKRLRLIFRAARAAGGSVNLDMETYGLKNLTMDIFMELVDEEEFRDWSGAGLALQAYLPDTWNDLHRVIELGHARGRPITIRLVKGAYWEYETVTALQRGWPVPVYRTKGHTDWNFERCTELMLAHITAVTPAIATHNVRSLAAAMVAAETAGAAADQYEFQMLYGMAEPVKSAVRQLGYMVREYVPIGALLPGMSYLVRRLLENSSNEGFLRRAFVEKVDAEALLAAPEPPDEATPALEQGSPEGFRNEPFLDFSNPSSRSDCLAALERVRNRLGQNFSVRIDGHELTGPDIILSVNPARPSQVVGSVAALDHGTLARAVAAARRAMPLWRTRTPAERAGYLFRAAAAARAARTDLLAWQVYETGKGWAEADADVAETIDYLEYYGREMLRLGVPFKVGELPGEVNRYSYRPRGVALVIAPWNFPLAISAGMVAAALVAGNTVLYKPSSLSVVNGWQLCELFRQAGLPEGVLNFTPGRGQLFSDLAGQCADLDLIAFTGSRDVGLGLVEQAARRVPGQRSVKRIIAEMGGKNAIIVDTDADLDLAVAGVLHSAFSYQGQKCSACSRVIVLEGCYDRFMERLCEAVRDIVVGPPEDPSSFMGPLIEAAAVERVEAFITEGSREGRLAARGTAPTGGWYVAPTVITDLPPESSLLREEIFGPVLAVLKAQTLEEALALANDSEYALTGGLYSRSPNHIRQATEQFAVGNLYINRGITGAMVGRQPFGGFGMSGIGSKAGGPDYLLQFMEPQVVTENTMRRSFTPEIIG